MPNRLAAIVGLLILVTDQITKVLVRREFEVHDTGMDIIPGFFRLARVENKGAAFGILNNLSDPWRVPFFTVASLVAIGLLFVLIRGVGKPDRLLLSAYGAILGGALGNMIDRLRFGMVTDFFEFSLGSYTWPNFNVADSGISVGITLIVLHLLIHGDSTEVPASDPGTAERRQ